MSQSTLTLDSRSRNGRAEPLVARLAPHSKPRVAYYHHKDVGNFHYGVWQGSGHPMKPHRLTLTNDLVLNYRLHEKMQVYCPPMATEQQLLEFHEVDYVEFLKRASADENESEGDGQVKFNVNADCPVFHGLYDFCRIYAGSSIAAALKLAHGDADICVNWSGGLHHAKSYEASGFCYVNDIVLAIQQLLRYYPRVLYIDIDIHHGDGVQEAFYATDRVLTASFHKYDGEYFPGTGDLNEIGSGLGKYYCVNVPLKDGVDDESYVSLFKDVMTAVNERYRPAAVVLQCGADSLGLDRLGHFNLSIRAHGECVNFIKSWNLPLLVLGGGGYTIHNVARCWTFETSILIDTQLPDELPKNSKWLPFFGPDYKLHPDLVRRVDNLNAKSELQRLRTTIHEQLRYLDGAPGVQMQEFPGGLQEFLDRNEDSLKDEKDDRNADVRRRGGLRNENEFFDGDDDQDRDDENTMDIDAS